VEGFQWNHKYSSFECDCWNCFQGQRSDIKVIVWWSALYQQRYTHRLTAVRMLSMWWRNT